MFPLSVGVGGAGALPAPAGAGSDVAAVLSSPPPGAAVACPPRDAAARPPADVGVRPVPWDGGGVSSNKTMPGVRDG